jgi:hypothetical protein
MRVSCGARTINLLYPLTPALNEFVRILTANEYIARQ